MNDLTNLEAIKKIDPQDTLSSTELIVKQCEAAWEQVSAISVPDNYKNITQIVFCGMGASIYGALVTKALFGPKFPYPTETISDYHLPSYVGEQTLVVLTSYSGTTEEVLSCARDAKQKNAKMLILTKGGELAEFAKENNVPAYIFDGALNPAGVPRLGNGYSILGLMGLLAKAGVITVNESELQAALSRLGANLESIKKQAIVDSEKLENKIPVVFAAEHLSGNAQILRNQFNETSKAFSCFYLVPDLNHHLMEGLQFPHDADLYFIMLNSKNYSPKIQKRMELTTDVVTQNKRVIHEYNFDGETIYDDFLTCLAMGSYLTLFLGLRYDQNPAINPWVDYFKEKLKD